MLLFKKSLFILKIIISIFTFSILLSACSFTPLYGTKGQVNNIIDLSYAKPNTRLEQIIYQDLKLKLGEKANSSLVTIKVSASSKNVARTATGTPSSIKEAVLSAIISVTNEENSNILTITRRASTSYSTNGQRIADLKAFEDASEKAALELAQIIRLALISNLSRDN